MKALWDFFVPEDDYLFPEITKDNTLWKKCVDDWFLETEENYKICNLLFVICFLVAATPHYDCH